MQVKLDLKIGYMLKVKVTISGTVRIMTSLSVGSIILLAFLTIVLLYLIVGSLYKRAVYNLTGCDVIPNIAFWASLPGLIRDGYLFFLSPCIGRRVEYRTYQQIDTT